MLNKNRFRNSSFIALTLACSVLLSACAKDHRTTGSIGRTAKPIEQMTVQELKRTTAKYGKLYDRDPKNKQVGLFYASILRTTGRNEQALAVMQQMVIHHPEDNDVLASYGKALAATGNLAKALKIIERAQRPDRPDWRLFSAQGAILDQSQSAGYCSKRSNCAFKPRHVICTQWGFENCGNLSSGSY